MPSTLPSAAIGWPRWPLAWLPTSPSLDVLIIGTGPEAVALASTIRQRRKTGLKVTGFVGDSMIPRENFQLGSVGQLPEIVREHRPAAVVVEQLGGPLDSTLLACLDSGVQVLTYAMVYERLEGKIPFSMIDASWCISTLSRQPSQAQVMAKRTLDVSLALIGLLGTLLLLPFIALAIWLGGGAGPLLYSQRRVGFQGKEFTIYKFRTMRQDAEKHGVAWASQNDDRVTATGRFLRQTRLDELPQFWNVLRGDMSLIGPRPERPEFVQMLEREIEFYSLRNNMLPGVSGWAQVSFPYGASVDDARGKLEYDLYYLKNRSIWMDLKIIAKTFLVVFGRIGAR